MKNQDVRHPSSSRQMWKAKGDPQTVNRRLQELIAKTQSDEPQESDLHPLKSINVPCQERSPVSLKRLWTVFFSITRRLSSAVNYLGKVDLLEFVMGELSLITSARFPQNIVKCSSALVESTVGALGWSSSNALSEESAESKKFRASSLRRPASECQGSASWQCSAQAKGFLIGNNNPVVYVEERRRSRARDMKATRSVWILRVTATFVESHLVNTIPSPSGPVTLDSQDFPKNRNILLPGEADHVTFVRVVLDPPINEPRGELRVNAGLTKPDRRDKKYGIIDIPQIENRPKNQSPHQQLLVVRRKWTSQQRTLEY
ncbi:hypothetical protein J6590_022321 [Homalodisca vitripennis]|nr:hypothetical protein J6590_022321 [Homalodisca vitripennis]